MGIVSFSLHLLNNRYSFRKTQYFYLVILTMKFITLQFLGVAMLMMLYTFAVPLSEERQGGEENEMLREGFRGEENEMLREGGNVMQNGPGEEEEPKCKDEAAVEKENKC